MQFYSGPTGQAGRFSEGFCLRRVHSGTKVSNLAVLADLGELALLDVSNTAVTTQAALYGLSNLREVNIEGTRIPPAEAARFNDRTRQSGYGSSGGRF